MHRPKHFLDRNGVIAACNLKNNLQLKELIDAGRFFHPCGRHGNTHLWCPDLVKQWARLYHQCGCYPTKEDVTDMYLENLIMTTSAL
jgi:hypothetical protein